MSRLKSSWKPVFESIFSRKYVFFRILFSPTDTWPDKLLGFSRSFFFSFFNAVLYFDLFESFSSFHLFFQRFSFSFFSFVLHSFTFFLSFPSIYWEFSMDTFLVNYCYFLMHMNNRFCSFMLFLSCLLVYILRFNSFFYPLTLSLCYFIFLTHSLSLLLLFLCICLLFFSVQRLW